METRTSRPEAYNHFVAGFLLRHFAPERNIVLAGFMGAGKTTVGRLLARELSRRFVDLDEALAKRHHLPVGEIFARRGEELFRHWERELACKLAQQKNLVLALGGGTLEDEVSANELAVFGFIVYLQAPFEVLWKRISADDTCRPLVEKLEREGMEALLAARSENYEQRSHFIVYTEALSPEAIVKVIQHAFRS